MVGLLTPVIRTVELMLLPSTLDLGARFSF
jgi:hypothetical protein